LARYSASGFHLYIKTGNISLYPIIYQNIKTELKIFWIFSFRRDESSSKLRIFFPFFQIFILCDDWGSWMFSLQLFQVLFQLVSNRWVKNGQIIFILTYT